MKINKRTRVWPIFYIKAETGLVKEAIFGRTEVLNKKSYTKYIGSFRWLRKRWIVRWNGPSRPFSFIFGLFIQTMQQIYVKIAHPESGVRIQTYNLFSHDHQGSHYVCVSSNISFSSFGSKQFLFNENSEFTVLPYFAFTYFWCSQNWILHWSEFS